jgi:hypothetical protein
MQQALRMSTVVEAESTYSMTAARSNGGTSPFKTINKSGKQTYQKTEEPKRRIRANVKETGFDSMKYYMKTMGNHELLKKNEEIILAREIQSLIKWEETREELEAKLMR